MDVYSAALSLAMLTVGVSLLTALSVRLSAHGSSSDARAALRRLARLGAVASLALVAVSLVAHLLTGHRPGTPTGMSVPEFVLEHPALVVVPVLATLVLRWLPTGPRP